MLHAAGGGAARPVISPAARRLWEDHRQPIADLKHIFKDQQNVPIADVKKELRKRGLLGEEPRASKSRKASAVRQNAAPEATGTAPKTAAPAPASASTAQQDPLLLDGCRIAVEWPRKKIQKKPIRRVGKIHYQPDEDSNIATTKRRRPENHYLILFISRPNGRQPQRERWTRWSRLKKRKLQVLEGTRHEKNGKWCEDEHEAFVVRMASGEPDESIAQSLGRTVTSVKFRRNRYTKPGYAPSGEGKTGLTVDRSVHWGNAIERAIVLLPDERGTVFQVMEKLKELGFELDETIAPGQRETRGRRLVGSTLSHQNYPQFYNTGEKDGQRAIYQYRPDLAVAEPQPAPKPRSNAKSRKAGYDNVTMKTG